MIKIIICEDEAIYVNRTQEIINGILNTEVICFDSGESLLEHIKDDNFSADIYIIDIELPGINGLETASKIRKADKYAIIIFLTSHDRYVFDSFEVRAFRYILKDNIESTLVPAIKAAIQQLEAQNRYKYITIKTKDSGILRIELDDIISIEKAGKLIEFRLKNGTLIKDNRTLKDFMNEIKNECFVIAQKGVIVNVLNIINFNGSKLTMADNSVQYVSRNNMKTVKLAIARAWR